MSRPPSAGERRFGRYASSPNELGYCGPNAAGLLVAAARGEELAQPLRPIAEQFSGAWVYQEVLGGLLDRDPLDESIVRGYWLGGAAGQVDAGEFWRRLLAVIGPRAGAYWKHLDEHLAAEAQPSHAFHVLGVYPWTRLLPTGRPEPLEVLNSCCLRPARVLEVRDDGLVVAEDALRYEAGALRLETVELAGVAHPFDDEVAPGATVAVHWGSACAVLDAGEEAELRAGLLRQLELCAPRLVDEASR